ncbi:MAG: hypothetical protein J6X88_02690 [Bacteroidales bacterium]|nr:hypothetical protein [Bacteroidales bacterium]
MEEKEFNWGWVLASVVLLAVAYYTLNGMLYRMSWIGAVPLTVLLLVSVPVVVALMCWARSSAWKKLSRSGQIATLAIFLSAVFGIASVPFTSFISAQQHKDQIAKSLSEVKDAALKQSQDYNNYAQKRVAEYACTHNALQVQSLQHRLMPPTLDSCQREREAWIERIEGMSTSNMMLPANLNKLEQAVKSWETDYQELSDFSLEDESIQSYSDTTFNSSFTRLNNEIRHPQFSLWALLLFLLAGAFMLLPWLLTKASVDVNLTDDEVF